MKRQKLINTESARDYFSNLDQVKADFDSFNGLNQTKVRTNRLSRSQWKLEALDLCRLNYDLMTYDLIFIFRANYPFKLI